MINLNEFLSPVHVKARKSWTGSTPPNDLLEAIDSGEWMVEVKEDGSWYQFVTDGHGTSQLLSRRLSTVTGKYIDRSENVPHIIQMLEKIASGKPLVVQGEATNNIGFSSSSGIMGSLPEKAIQTQVDGGSKTVIRYVIHDILVAHDYDLRNDTYSERRQIYQTLFNSPDLKKSVIRPVRLFDYASIADIDDILDHVELEGVEGLMLKRPASVFDGRDAMRKFKKTWTEDVFVIGWEKGTGKYSDCIGYLVCVTKDKRVVRVGGGLTDDDRSKMMWHVTPYVIELEHYGRQKNSLRHPQMFRSRFLDSVTVPQWVYSWAARFDKEGLKGVR